VLEASVLTGALLTRTEAKLKTARNALRNYSAMAKHFIDEVWQVDLT
jgi:hypothetical protein